MGVKTPWAFVSETGPNRVTAQGIRQLRAEYDGRRIGEVYFSPHEPGRRKKMKHVIRDGTAFFAYLSAADEHAAGPGESLSHRLYKETLASLSGTKLKLNGGRGEETITITRGEVEKEIVHADGSYYADAYLQFESNGELGTKWSGELYVEVHKTHEVPRLKIDGLRSLRLPVIEVEVPPFADYRIDDDKTTDQLEEAHRCRVKRILEGETGFLYGKVLHDPSSAEYLELELLRATDELQKLRRVAAETSSARDVAVDRERDLAARLDTLKASSDGLRRQVESLTKKLWDTEATNTNLADDLRQKSELLDNTSQELKSWKLGSVLVLAAVMVIGLLKLVLFVKSRLS